MGVYFNKELITHGKARHLFVNTTCSSTLNLLVIDRIIPCKPELFHEKRFFPQLSQETEVRDDSSFSEADSGNTITSTDVALSRKRQRAKPTFFYPVQPVSSTMGAQGVGLTGIATSPDSIDSDDEQIKRRQESKSILR